MIFNGAEKMIDKKLELIFIDKEGKFYPIDEVNSVELAKGLERLSQEIATRLRLQKEQR
jgi:hypothetical protein